MAYVERECTLVGKVHWPGSKPNQWGASLIVDSDGRFRYVSAWGKRGEKPHHALGFPEESPAATDRFRTSRAEKLATGYTYDYDYLGLSILFDEIAKQLTSMEKMEAQLIKKVPTSSSTAVYPETCGYCYFKDRPSTDPFWNAVCTICAGAPAYEHANSHPHNSTPGTKPCAQFSQTPDQWGALGWWPGMLKMQPKPPTLSVPKPQIWTPKPDDNLCPGCIVRSPANSNNNKLKHAFGAVMCTSCGRGLGLHNYSHPHPSLPGFEGDCAFMSFPPKAYGLVGLTEAELSKVAEPEAGTDPDCPLCDVNTRTNISQSARRSFYELECLDCGIDLDDHSRSHPHTWAGCGGVQLPGIAYSKAMLKTPGRSVPPPSATTRRGAAESKPVELPNLPCDCEHLWSYHASHIELATFACLLITCHCEAYRHTCPECGEQTRREIRHKSTCLTYERSQLLAEPSGDTPARKPRHQRLPRRISHLLLNDDD